MINKILGYNLKETSPFEKDKLTFIIVLSLFMVVTLFGLAPYLFLQNEFSTGFIVILNSIVFFVPVYLCRLKDFENAKSSFVSIYLITQLLQVIFGGGIEPRQMIFLPMSAMFAFFLLGKQRGFIISAICVIVMFAVLGLFYMGISFPRVNSYDNNMEMSFVLSLLFFFIKASLLFVFYEKFSETYRTSILKLNKRLDNAQVIGKTGSFWLDVKTGKLELSNGLYHMFDPEILEKKKLEGFKEIEKFIHKNDIQIVNETLSKSREKLIFDSFEFRVFGPDKKLKYFQAKGKLSDDNKSIIGVVEDITSTKMASKNFEDYKNALDQSALVTITNRSGKIIYTNENFQKVTKYSNEELIGKDHSIINSGAHDASFFRKLWTTIANGNIWRGTIKNQAKDNSFFWVDTTIIPFFDEKGLPDYYIAIRFDITDQAVSSDEIIRKNKELEQFSYVLSHDLKSPLRAIKTLIHFIKEDMEEASLQLPEEVKKNFDLIDGRVVKMEALIMSVLAYAQVGSSKEKEWIPLNEIVSEVLELIDIPQNFTINVSKDLPTLLMNRVELKQVIQNLMTNAIKYNNNENPEISVYPGLKRKNYLIHIKDNGKGIDPMFHEKIFNLFETLKQKETYEATGIGLPIVKKVIEKSGGNISVRSKKDEGADFILSFPFSVCKM